MELLAGSGDLQEEAPGLGKPVLVLGGAKCAADGVPRRSSGRDVVGSGDEPRLNSAIGAKIVKKFCRA
ncbi:MAG: hypothetical protein JXA33_01510 [Anaerolineae bacterium]|nr:hypothetical protein [Anaerolineae bacterium]